MRIFWVVLLLGFAAAAMAAGPSAVRKQAESRMLVTGTIEIAADGQVRGHVLDSPEKVPPAVRALVDKALPTWRFEPVPASGTDNVMRATMSLVLVARKLENGNYSLSLRSAHFDDGDAVEGAHVTAGRLTPPNYPPAAFEAGISGTVYLLIRVGRDGKPEEVVVEQVNLNVVGSEQQMQRGRDALAKASMLAARRWTFRPPVAGEHATAPYWSTRIPVKYAFQDQREAGYGEWETYIPGPRQPAPWLEDKDKRIALDALPADKVHMVGTGPRLLTPIGDDAG